MLVGKEVGEEEGKGNGSGFSPEGEGMHPGFFVLRFFSFLQAGILGEFSGEGSSRTFFSCDLSVEHSPGAPFQGRGLH